MIPDNIRKEMIPRDGGARSTGGPVAGIYIAGIIKQKQ
jgi:hypothetical protein